MGAHHFVGDGLADARWQLDSHAEYQFQRRAVDSQRHYAVERRLCGEPVADGIDVLGGDVDLYGGQHLRSEVSGSDKQDLHLLDGRQCDYHYDHAADYGGC